MLWTTVIQQQMWNKVTAIYRSGKGHKTNHWNSPMINKDTVGMAENFKHLGFTLDKNSPLNSTQCSQLALLNAQFVQGDIVKRNKSLMLIGWMFTGCQQCTGSGQLLTTVRRWHVSCSNLHKHWVDMKLFTHHHCCWCSCLIDITDMFFFTHSNYVYMDPKILTTNIILENLSGIWLLHELLIEYYIHNPDYMLQRLVLRDSSQHYVLLLYTWTQQQKAVKAPRGHWTLGFRYRHLSTNSRNLSVCMAVLLIGITLCMCIVKGIVHPKIQNSLIIYSLLCSFRGKQHCSQIQIQMSVSSEIEIWLKAESFTSYCCCFILLQSGTQRTFRPSHSGHFNLTTASVCIKRLCVRLFCHYTDHLTYFTH